METFNITWFTVHPKKHLRLTKWQRTAGVDDAGQVWVPAAVAGGESMVFACAAWDNEPGIFLDRHLFVRTAWLRREFSGAAETLDAIEAKVKMAIKGD